MNRDRVEIKMNRQAEKTIGHRQDMTNNELAVIGGKYKQFEGILQKKIGAAREEVNRRVDALKTIIVQFKNPIGS